MTSLDDGENGEDVKTDFIEELYDKFLECRLCSRTYRHPKMLVCQHTFCADCLEAHYEMDEQDRPYRFLLSHNRDLSCPCCRARTPLPSGGIWRLPDNFLVANLTDVIRRRGPAVASKSGGGGCEICRPASIVWNDDQSGSVEDSRQQTATVKCVDCDKLLCADCAELHRETKVTASHVLFTISDNRDVQCKIHRNETLRFYCEPCEQCVCVLCALHEHKEHEVSSLADGLERHRGTFDALLDDCKTRIDAVRQQLTLADAFKSSLDVAEDHVRHAAIDAIAAVRKREKELLDGLRCFVGDDAIRFVDQRDTLSVRLAELENVRETTETMVGRTSVELLMTKKEVHERLHTALNRQKIQTPDRVRLGAVRYVAGAKAFHGLHRPTSDIVKLFRSVANNDDVGDDAAENAATDGSSATSSSSESESETGSADSDSENKQRQSGTVYVVSELPQLEHTGLVARSQNDSESEEDSNGDDDDNDSRDENDRNQTAAPISKICISDGVVRRIVIKSQSLCDATEDSAPPPRPRERRIPDFSRPKPVVQCVDRGTEMERVETTDAATATPRVVVCDKETYTGYIYLVHKNVSTDNQGTAEKGTSTVTDVTAAYRNVSNSGRSTTFNRGTNTVKTMMSDRASSPIAALLSPSLPTNPQAIVAKAPAYPTNQKSGSVSVPSTTQKSSTSDAASQISPVAGKVPADAQKVTGTANMALHTPQVTSLTSPATSVQPVSATTSTSTTSQKQAMPIVSPTVQAGPTSSKPPPLSQKLVTSSSAVSASLPAMAATAPSQFVTSPSHAVTSPVAVSAPLHQKLPPASTSSVTLAAVTASTVPINSPTVAVAGASTTSTTTLTAAQKPVTSSNGVPSSSAQLSPINAAPQPASSTHIYQSVNNSRMQTVSSKALTSPSKQISTSTTLTTAPMTVTAATITSPLPASTQKHSTSEQASWSRQSQPSPGRSPPSTLPLQSPADSVPAVQPVSMASSSQITSPVTQISSTLQQRTSSTALSSSASQKTLPLASQSAHTATASGIDTVATSPTANKLTTPTVSQFQSTSNTAPINVTSTMPVQSQLHTTSSNTPLLNNVTNSVYVFATAQKPVTSSASPTTTHPQLATAVTTVMTTAKSMTSQAATHNIHVTNAATSPPMALTPTQNLMTATTLSPAQMAVPTAQKPVASSTTQSQRQTVLTTIAQSVTSQVATSTGHLSNAATSMPLVSTTAQQSVTASQISASLSAQKLMTSDNGQREAAASVTSASENSAAAAPMHLAVTSPNAQLSASRVTSPTPVSNSTRPRSVFRSISMDNVRTPAPVLRPPPPIMTTSVAAVTQRLNGGGANGSSKNGWRPNK